MARVDAAKTIEWIQEEYGLTQADVGKALGKTQSTVSDWIRGKSKPDGLVLHIFGCKRCRDHFFGEG